MIEAQAKGLGFCVAEVVEPDPRDVGEVLVAESAVEGLGEDLGVERLAVGAGKHEPVVLVRGAELQPSGALLLLPLSEAQEEPVFLPREAREDMAHLRVRSLSPGAAFLQPVRSAMVRADVSHALVPHQLKHFAPDPTFDAPLPSPLTDDDIA